MRGAANTAIAVVQSGIPIARCELLDTATVAAANAFSGLGETEAPTLFLEFHGAPAAVASQLEDVQALAAENGGTGWRTATRAEDRSRLWKARHDVYFASVAMRPGCRSVTTDACVPVSRLADCIEETLAEIERLPFPAPIVGHAADGNFHCAVLIMPDDPAERRLASAFSGRLAERAIAMGGTCTGEHGVGLGKAKYLARQFGPEAVELMRTIKKALDPQGLFNPGKILE